MKKKLLFLFITTFFLCDAQQSEKYKSFLNQLEQVESESNTKLFKNGNIKNISTLVTYKVGEYECYFYVGKVNKYKKNGDKLFELLLDETGVTLNSKSYWNGKLWIKSSTIEIDTNATNIEEFIFGKSVSIIYEEEVHYFDKKKNAIVLSEKGIKVNNKKSGLWTFYKNGKINKQKHYKKVDKFKNPIKPSYLKL